MSEDPSQFVWYELMTSDVKAAGSFYGSVVGWDAKDSGLPDRTYLILSMGATMVGGLMAIPEDAGARPGWLGYIAVSDVDAYAARVKAAGGAVHRAPEDIPGIGRFAAVADPHGAIFILFKGMGDQPSGDAARDLGRVGWHELHAGNLEEAFAFYSGLFGWTKGDAVDMGPMGTYQMFAAGGAPIGGMMTKTPEIPAPTWLYYFNVDKADAAAERIAAAGGTVAMGPHEVPGPMWI